MMTPRSPSLVRRILYHLLEGEADHVEGAYEIDLHDPVELGKRHGALLREGLAGNADAGAVDDHAETAESFHRFADCFLDALIARHIGPGKNDMPPQFGRQFLTPLDGEVEDGHLCPGARQLPDAGLTETRCPSRDHGNALAHPHVSLLSRPGPPALLHARLSDGVQRLMWMVDLTDYGLHPETRAYTQDQSRRPLPPCSACAVRRLSFNLSFTRVQNVPERSGSNRRNHTA